MLRVEDISVRFGGLMALDGVGFDAGAGVVTGLIGPNGAGKTTLFNVVTGLQRPNRGRVFLGDLDVTGLGPKRRARQGIGRTFQRLETFGSLSARDNVLVALEAHGERGRRARDRAHALLERVGLGHAADTQADVLPTGAARLLELARALARDPSVVLLDETSAGLDANETTALGDLLQELSREGRAVLLVEHDMKLVMRVCSYIYVLDFGRVIAEGQPVDVQSNPTVQSAYLGTSASEAAE
jgi:branched-chain amino acid transport system ATP-binding protein